jgi:hypothetical protein
MFGPMGDAMNTIMASQLAKERSSRTTDRSARTADRSVPRLATPRRARARAAVSAGWHWVRALATAILR